MKIPRPRFALLLLALLPLRGADVTTEANRPVEITFEAVKRYADPFNEVTLDAVFSAPGGRTHRVPAFWAGGSTWRVRYASPHPGTHRYRTECSDPANPALHGVTGAVTVTSYTGTKISSAAKGIRAFSPPGKNAAGDADWVLTLERIR